MLSTVPQCVNGSDDGVPLSRAPCTAHHLARVPTLHALCCERAQELCTGLHWRRWSSRVDARGQGQAQSDCSCDHAASHVVPFIRRTHLLSHSSQHAIASPLYAAVCLSRTPRALRASRTVCLECTPSRHHAFMRTPLHTVTDCTPRQMYLLY